MISLKGDRNDNVEDSDRDVVEHYLTEKPIETESCIPVALRNMLENRYLPAMTFPSRKKLLEHLSILWSNDPINDKLASAAAHGLNHLIVYYLIRGADIRTKLNRPLRSAAGGGHTDTVRLILDQKVDVHAERDAALRWAAGDGHIDTVKFLLGRKADIHADHEDALMWSARNGQTEVVRFLLDQKANIQSI